jgi:hypothetical protein
MFSETIASELRAGGHDVLAVVTANIKDFMPLL